jgi:PAS domain S-box-containing protein
LTQALNRREPVAGWSAEAPGRGFGLAEEIGWIGCYEIDFSDWSTLMSPTCRAQFGMTPEQERLSHAEWLARIHPGDLERMRDHVRAKIARTGPESIEYRIVRPDGAVRWIWARTRIDYDAAGEPIAGQGVQQDVTERRLAEDTLRERELHFRTAAEQTSDLIYAYDIDTAAIQWFGDVDGAFGYPPGLFPRTIDGWEAHIQLEDRAEATAALHRHIEEGAPFDVEYRTLSLDGTIRYWVDRGRLVQGLDGGRLMVGAMTDITEQRKTLQALAESEERFRHMADHMPAMAWLTGADGQTLFLSRSWYDLTGQTPETALGQGWMEAIHPMDRTSALATIAEEARARRTFQNDFRLLLPDGSTRWMLNAGVPRFDKDGAFLGYVGCVIDITERKQAEDRITWAAEHDGLTGLANRTRFQAELRRALDDAAAAGETLALIVFDLDHLKLVNDTLGHDAGDHLIRSVGTRMRDALSGDGLVARLGGDEFGIILRSVEGRHAARPSGPEHRLPRQHGPDALPQ